MMRAFLALALALGLASPVLAQRTPPPGGSAPISSPLGASSTAGYPCRSGDSTTCLYSSGASLIDAIVGGTHAFQISPNATGTGDDGILIDSIQQLGTGTFRFNLTSASNNYLFKGNSSPWLQVGPTTVQPDLPVDFNPATSVSGAYNDQTNGLFYATPTYTGSINNSLTASSLVVTFNESQSLAGSNNVVFRLEGDTGANTTKNLYTTDIYATVGSGTGSIESHAARYTSGTNYNMTGTNGNPQGFIIGIKQQAIVGTPNGTGYIALNMAQEVDADNQDATTQDECGVCISAGGTVGTTRNDDGIMFTGGSDGLGGTGYFTKYLIDFEANGYGTAIATTGTLMGSAGTFTTTNGIDLHNVTFTGYAYYDGHIKIDPSGNITLNGNTHVACSGSPSASFATDANGMTTHC